MSSVKVLGSVSPYCKNGNNCSGYLLHQDGGNKILLDCGFGVTSEMNIPEDLKKLSIFISHLHKDHYAELFAIAYASYCYAKIGILKEKIKVYIPATLETSDVFNDYVLIKNGDTNYFDIITYDENSSIKIGDSIITFFKTKHSVDNYSIRINNSKFTLTYSGDMGYFNVENYIKFCEKSDLFICESTYLNNDNKEDDNHLHAQQSAMIAKMANAKQLVLTHMWPEHNKANYVAEAKVIFNNTIAADTGMIIDL